MNTASSFGPVRKDRYEWLKVIGRGQQTVVWLARDLDEDNAKAIRVISKEWIHQNDAQTLAAVRDLMELLSVFSCKFLAACNGWFTDGPSECYVQEFCQGGELLTYARRDTDRFPTGTLPQEITAFYMAQVLLALDHCHKNKLVYLDLRPESMLLTASGNLKLTDLFHAKRIGSKIRTTPNPEYMAPEVIDGDDTYAPSMDWWSFGIVVFELLQGHPPFYSDSPSNIIELAREAVISFPDSFDPRGSELVESLLVVDPAKRLGSQKRGVDDIKKHKFFASLEWDQIIMQLVTPPIVPTLSGMYDYSAFDEFPFLTPDEQKQSSERPSLSGFDSSHIDINDSSAQ